VLAAVAGASSTGGATEGCEDEAAGVETWRTVTGAYFVAAEIPKRPDRCVALVASAQWATQLYEIALTFVVFWLLWRWRARPERNPSARRQVMQSTHRACPPILPAPD
jgi:prolipoprotein diacylglyceryltransferase